PSGTRSRLSVFTTTWVAYDPGASCQATRSPAEKLSTPSPTAAILPVPSEPTICGYSIGYTPERRYVSMKFTPAASTSTSTSPGPATGVSTSLNSRTSGPPASIARTAWVMTPPAYNLMCWYSYTYERFQCCRLRCLRIRRGRGPPAPEHSPPSERHNGVRTFFRGRDTRPTSTPSSPILRTCGSRVHRRGARRPRCRRPGAAARSVRGDLRRAREDEPGHPHRRPRRRPPAHQRHCVGEVLRLRPPRHLDLRTARAAHRRRHEAARSTDRHEAHRRARLQRHRRDPRPRTAHPGRPRRARGPQCRARQRGLRSRQSTETASDRGRSPRRRLALRHGWDPPACARDRTGPQPRPRRRRGRRADADLLHPDARAHGPRNPRNHHRRSRRGRTTHRRRTPRRRSTQGP